VFGFPIHGKWIIIKQGLQVRVNTPSFVGTLYYLPNWYVAHQQGKIVWEQMDVYSFGIVLLEILSGKVPGFKRRDSIDRTLRNFVNNDIINHVELPTEYIATFDDDFVPNQNQSQ